MRRGITDRLAYGDAVIERFGADVPAAVKDDHKQFKAQHLAYAGATAEVAKAESSYDEVARQVSDLDGLRDKTVMSIADLLPAAGLGSRTKPFGKFSSYSPTKLTALPYAAQTVELRALLSALLEAGPPADIAKLCGQCSRQNDAVDDALKALTRPLASLNEARARRDALVPDWEKHLRRLRDASRVALRDEPGRHDALFDEPTAMQTNVKPRKRQVTAPAAPPADPAPGQAPQPTRPSRKRRRGG